MIRRLLPLIVLFISALLAGCGVTSPTSRGVPAALTPTALPKHVVLSVVIVPSIQGKVVLASGSCCVGGEAGSTVQIPATFSATSTKGSVSEMRVRAGGGGCAEEGDLDAIAWEPFATSKTYQFAGIPINWSGYYVSVQFRDTSGAVSPIACDDVSVEGMPPASTVEGSVVLANGNCCVGGKAGTTVQIPAAFSASSTRGSVSEMRVRAGGGGCAKAGELDAIAWEPFVKNKTYSYASIPINWSGYYVSVQFRDASGAVSPIACDDVSVEGMP